MLRKGGSKIKILLHLYVFYNEHFVVSVAKILINVQCPDNTASHTFFTAGKLYTVPLFTVRDCWKYLDKVSLSKASGPDGISVRILCQFNQSD